MNFQEAEKAYKDLRIRHTNGKLSDADFEAQVSQLKVQDAQGRWWQIGVRSGDWYVNDGQKWTKARPPVAMAQAAAPTTSPEEPGAEQPARVSVLPRGLFAPKPAERNGGGLPTSVLIGIIAVAAIAVVVILAGSYFLFSGQPSRSATRTTTAPTLAAALTEVPTPALPLVPITSTLVLSPTIEVTPTATVTPTNTVAPTTPRPTAVRRTATPTPTVLKATATPNVPPGIYVTKLQLDTPVPEPNKPFGFRVTFFNNSGGTWHSERGWQILIFQVNNQDRSFGETAIRVTDIQPGTTEVALPESWNVGPAGPPDCNYLAGAYSIAENGTKVPLLQLDGRQFRLSFSVCK